jgi:hypothetical protein
LRSKGDLFPTTDHAREQISKRLTEIMTNISANRVRRRSLIITCRVMLVRTSVIHDNLPMSTTTIEGRAYWRYIRESDSSIKKRKYIIRRRKRYVWKRFVVSQMDSPDALHILLKNPIPRYLYKLSIPDFIPGAPWTVKAYVRDRRCSTWGNGDHSSVKVQK